jgi:hypothetical protein
MNEAAAVNANVSAVERAFQIAKSGNVKTVDEIRTVLSKEGFARSHLDGTPTLARQLKNIIKTARTNNASA